MSGMRPPELLIIGTNAALFEHCSVRMTSRGEVRSDHKVRLFSELSIARLYQYA